MLTICSRAGARSVKSFKKLLLAGYLRATRCLTSTSTPTGKSSLACWRRWTSSSAGWRMDSPPRGSGTRRSQARRQPQLPCCHGTRLALIGVVRSVLSVFRRQRRAGGQPRRQALGLIMCDGDTELAAEGRKRYVYGRTALFASQLTFSLFSKDLLNSRQGPCTRAGCDRPPGCTARCSRTRARC